MIKVNLLDSVTEGASSFAAVEARVATPRAQGWLMLLAVVALTLLAMGFDWQTARSARAEAQTQLEQQQRIATQMQAVEREQAELEKKTKEVQTRIEAIKHLRDSQQGPVAVLSEINDRLPKIENFRLSAIEQKGGDLSISGDSPNEDAVTQFARSLEFSSGMFANLSIEIKRDILKAPEGSTVLLQDNKDAPKPQTITFTIKCKYTPAAPPPAPAPANNKPAAPPANQVAQNN
jgi:Tfp pilus assembly protein PilN